jgi:hypothetical protein
MAAFHHSEPKTGPVHRSSPDGSLSHTINEAENGQVYTHAQYPSEGYKGTGGGMSRHITPGGHPVDNSQPAFPVYHRR